MNLASISLAVALELLFEDANARRRDEEGKKPRSRRGYLLLLGRHGHPAVGTHHTEATCAAAAWNTIHTDTNPLR